MSRASVWRGDSRAAFALIKSIKTLTLRSSPASLQKSQSTQFESASTLSVESPPGETARLTKQEPQQTTRLESAQQIDRHILERHRQMLPRHLDEPVRELLDLAQRRATRRTRVHREEQRGRGLFLQRTIEGPAFTHEPSKRGRGKDPLSDEVRTKSRDRDEMRWGERTS